MMNKYRLKNGAVKWNSAMKGTDTDLSIGTQTRLSSCAITGIEGTCWSPSIWWWKSLHPHIPQKNVMDPWPAPYQNSNYYWCSAYAQKTSGSNFLQTSVIFTVSTQCYTKGPYKEGELQTNLRCCFHCPAMLHALLGGESIGLLNDASSLLVTEKQIPHYCILEYMLQKLGSFPSLQYQREIQQQLHKWNWTWEPNFHIATAYTRSSSIFRDGLLVSGNLSVSEGTRYTYGNGQPQKFLVIQLLAWL